jgi:hypothetical protein
MRWLPHYMDIFNSAGNGEASREAYQRAMYARPDALPLPDEAPRPHASWRIAGLGRSVAKAIRASLGWLRRTGQKTADSA